jgi:hypothetical protein
MENNAKSRLKNALSRHKPLTDENIANVWTVNIENVYTNKNVPMLTNLDELQKYKKQMNEGTIRVDKELYNFTKARLKEESNKALRFFNRPTANTAKKRSVRRRSKTRRLL